MYIFYFSKYYCSVYSQSFNELKQFSNLFNKNKNYEIYFYFLKCIYYYIKNFITFNDFNWETYQLENGKIFFEEFRNNEYFYHPLRIFYIFDLNEYSNIKKSLIDNSSIIDLYNNNKILFSYFILDEYVCFFLNKKYNKENKKEFLNKIIEKNDLFDEEIIKIFENIKNGELNIFKFSDEEINFIEICIKIKIYLQINNLKFPDIIKMLKENHPLFINMKKIFLKSFVIIKNMKEIKNFKNDLCDLKNLINDFNIYIFENYNLDDVFLIINYILLDKDGIIESLNKIKNKNISLNDIKHLVLKNYFEYTQLPKNEKNIRNIIFEIYFKDFNEDFNEKFLNNQITYKNLFYFVPYFSIDSYIKKENFKYSFINEYLKYQKDLEKMFVLIKFINPFINKIYSLKLKKNDLNSPLKKYFKLEEIDFKNFSLAYKILTNKEFNKDCKLNYFIKDSNNNDVQNFENIIYKNFAEKYNKILIKIKNKIGKNGINLFEKEICLQKAHNEDILKILYLTIYEKDENIYKSFKLNESNNNNNNILNNKVQNEEINNEIILSSVVPEFFERKILTMNEKINLNIYRNFVLNIELLEKYIIENYLIDVKKIDINNLLPEFKFEENEKILEIKNLKEEFKFEETEKENSNMKQFLKKYKSKEKLTEEQIKNAKDFIDLNNLVPNKFIDQLFKLIFFINNLANEFEEYTNLNEVITEIKKIKISSSVFKEEFLDFFENNEICINNIIDLIENIEDIYFDNLIGNIKQNFDKVDDDNNDKKYKIIFNGNKKITRESFLKSLKRIIFRFLNDLNEDDNIFYIFNNNIYLFDEFEEIEYFKIKKGFNNKILAKNCLNIYNNLKYLY